MSDVLIDYSVNGELPGKCRSARCSPYNYIRDICIDERYNDGKYGIEIGNRKCTGYKDPLSRRVVQ